MDSQDEAVGVGERLRGVVVHLRLRLRLPKLQDGPMPMAAPGWEEVLCSPPGAQDLEGTFLIQGEATENEANIFESYLLDDSTSLLSRCLSVYLPYICNV